MTYKNRLVFLLSLISILSLTYTAGIIFDSQRTGARAASLVWLNPKLTGGITRITVNSQEQKFEFVKKNNQWFILYNGNEYPARQMRIEDFTGIFTTRAAWNIRSSNASSHSRFALDSSEAARVTIYGENTALLDLLFGNIGGAGSEIFVRKFGDNEVRSGENKISSYLTGPVNNWFNLRLFAESENAKVGVGDVQRLSVYHNGETQVFSRLNKNWNVSGVNLTNPDQGSIENYIKAVLNSEGDGFIDASVLQGIDFNNSLLAMEFGNGKVTTIRFSEPDENNLRYAASSESKYIYSIPSWASNRLFTDARNLETQ